MRKPLTECFKVMLTDEQAELVRDLSHRHNISFAEAIRVCLDRYVTLDAECSRRHKVEHPDSIGDIKKREGADSHRRASPS